LRILNLVAILSCEEAVGGATAGERFRKCMLVFVALSLLIHSTAALSTSNGISREALKEENLLKMECRK